MRYNIIINQVKAKEWGLNLQQASVFSFFYELPSWAESIIEDDKIYYFASKNKAVEELPILTEKKDTMYRIYKQIEEKGLISVIKKDGKDYILVTDKGKSWNEFKYNSEKNPNKLGKKSENNSEKNPTYNITSINNINTDINNSLVGSSQTPTKKDSKKDLFKTKLSEVDVTTLDKQEQVYFKIAIGFQRLFILNKKSLGLNDFQDQENATFKSYVDPIRLAFEKDKRTRDDFAKIFAFLQSDEFWMKNIMSTFKLRDKMSDLLVRSSSLPSKKLTLPSDWFHRELTPEQKSMLTEEQLKQWNMNKRKLEVEGGKLRPIEK